MSVLSTTTQINQNILAYGPAAVVAIQQFGGNATGPQKKSIFVRVMTGVEVGTEALESSPNPAVASAAMAANLIVQIAKLFKHPDFVAPDPNTPPQ